MWRLTYRNAWSLGLLACCIYREVSSDLFHLVSARRASIFRNYWLDSCAASNACAHHMYIVAIVISLSIYISVVRSLSPSLPLYNMNVLLLTYMHASLIVSHVRSNSHTTSTSNRLTGTSLRDFYATSPLGVLLTGLHQSFSCTLFGSVYLGRYALA